jgi:septum formation protein
VIFNNLERKRIILASNSPRRKQLLNQLGVKFEVITQPDINEDFPEDMIPEKAAIYLAEHKASQFDAEIDENTIVITADTIVVYKEKILNKPINFDHAQEMLNMLSGEKHTVITGVCLKSKENLVSFYSKTDVYFKKLDKIETDYYIYNFKPFDKAGAYGIQEWIGLACITGIEGSYFNVMGLPVDMLYEYLKKIE